MNSKFFNYFLLLLSLGGFFVFYCCSTETTIESRAQLAPLELEKAKQEFGRLLFNDKRLSVDQSIACASCHKEELAFTDGLSKSTGVKGRHAFRNSPSLFNLKDAPYFMHDGAVQTLEMQAIIPIQDTNEMGFSMKLLVERLKKVPTYSQKAKELFGREVDAFVITRSLASFQRTLISNDSRFDDFKKSDYKNGFNASEKRGWILFSDTYGCIECHSLPHFTNYKMTKNFIAINSNDWGRYRITGDEEDKGKFKTPSLRNNALTAPYMHDGSIEYIEDVFHKYHEIKDSLPIERMKNFNPSMKDQADLKAFLETLTDKKYTD